MTARWYVDEGLAKLSDEWKKAHPGAVVGTIADDHHATNPNVTQHAPDRGGSLPGDDRGEVDAGDFMPGRGVTEADLDGLFENLIAGRDPRILYLIHKHTIVSSVVSPWKKRTYGGEYHEHVHVSMNDRFDKNTADWKWEDEVARVLEYKDITGKLPELQTGDEDGAFPGWNHIGRAQALLNWIDNSLPDLDCDGVYGARTAVKLRKVMAGKPGTTTNGTKLREPEWRVLIGLSE